MGRAKGVDRGIEFIFIMRGKKKKRKKEQAAHGNSVQPKASGNIKKYTSLSYFLVKTQKLNK